jgi:hypothetical protein
MMPLLEPGISGPGTFSETPRMLPSRPPVSASSEILMMSHPSAPAMPYSDPPTVPTPESLQHLLAAGMPST